MKPGGDNALKIQFMLPALRRPIYKRWIIIFWWDPRRRPVR